jgi:N utilization substance protein A
VDIIRWHEEIKEFIAAALSPAQIAEIRPDLETKQALVVVADDQLSLTIGKRGQNVRLASKLTGWQLEIKSHSQLAGGTAAGGEVSLRTLPGVGPTLETRLQEAGITTVQQLAAMTLEQLCNVKGVGEKTAQKILIAAQEAPVPKPPADQVVETPAAEEPQLEAAPPEDAPPAPPEEPPQEPPQEPQEPSTS